MNSVRVWVCGLAVVLSAGLCWAQDGQPNRGREGRPGRGAGEGQRMLPFGGGDWKAKLETMTKELSLDQAQQTKAEEIFKQNQEKMRALMGEFRPSPEEQQKLRELRQAMEAAQKAGDEAKAKSLREEMNKIQQERRGKLAPVQEKIGALQQEQHDALVAILSEPQKTKFEDLWKQWSEPRRPPVNPRGPAALKTAIDKLNDLTEEQKTQIANLFEEFKKATRETDKESPEYRRLAAKLSTDVLKVLNPTQQEEIAKLLRGPEGRRGPGGADREGRREGGNREKGGKGNKGAGKE